MEDSLCRVSIVWSGAMTDVVLPRGIPLAVLLPDIVELVGGVHTDAPRIWRLNRLPDDRMDEAMTLQECGIRDGDTLTMSAVSAPVFVAARGEFRTVGSSEAALRGTRTPEAWAWCASVALVSLVWSMVVAGHHAMAPVLSALSAAAGAVIARRAPVPAARTSAGAVAVLFSAATGYLAMGVGPPHAPAVLLGAAAAALSSVALVKWTSCSVELLSASGIFACLLAAAAAAAVIWPAGLIVVALVLALAALGILGGAARVVIVLTGLDPAIPGRRASRVTDRRAEHARMVLAGVVSGGAAAAATGCVVMAVSCARVDAMPPLMPTAGPVLPAVLAGILLLRSRLYVDSTCRIALVIGGLICATVSCAVLSMSAPVHAGWITVAVVGVVGAAYAQRGSFSTSWARGVDMLEYVLLIVVIPLAGWTADIFGIARNMNLPW